MNHIQQEHKDHRPTNSPTRLSILAHDINDPLNVGSLFRLSDALGIEHLYLSGTTPVPPNRKLAKTARSADKYVSWVQQPDPHKLIKQLKQDKTSIVSLELTQDSIELTKFQPQADQHLCLVVGSENSGIKQSLLDLSDVVVHIGMCGHNSSMNLAMATAIAVYDLTHR